MTAATQLIERLEGVRERKPGQWLARCPAHEDRSPSLSIKECSDGRVLVHCFSGCASSDVVAALGLGLCDLFEKQPDYRRGPERERWHRRQLFELLIRESTVAAQAAMECAYGNRLNLEDARRVWLASRRLYETVEVLRGR